MCFYYVAFPLSAYGLSYWLPTIVQDFGVSNTANGFINIFPGSLSRLPCGSTRVGPPNRARKRRYCRTCAGRCCLSGPERLHAQQHIAIRVPMCRGSWNFCPQPVLWSLPSKFLTGASAAAGLAAINSVGNLGGFIAQNVVPWIRDVTGSTIAPMLFLAACLAAGGLMTFFVQAVIWRRHPELAVAA